MNTSMNGRKVRAFSFNDKHGNCIDVRVGVRNYDGFEDMSEPNVVTDIFLEATHHGTFDQFFIVEVMNGRERRHNIPSLLRFELEGV